MILVDTNILYELSEKCPTTRRDIIKTYLNKEPLYTNLISFLEISIKTSPLIAKNIITDNEILIITPYNQEISLGKKPEEYFKQIASSDILTIEFQKELKRKLDHLFQELYQAFLQIMLSIFTNCTIFPSLENHTEITYRNYQQINLFTKNRIPKLIEPLLNIFFKESDLKRSKKLNSNLNNLTLAFSVYLDALLHCNINQIDFFEYLKTNPEIVNKTKKKSFSKKIKTYAENNKEKIKQMFSTGSSSTDHSFNFTIELIFDYIINNRQIKMNDLVDSIIISSIKKYKILTLDKNMLKYLKSNDTISYDFSNNFSKLTNCV